MLTFDLVGRNSTVKNRKQPLVVLLITLVVGVLSRTVVTGFGLFDKYLGDALYTAAIFWLLRVMWPTWAIKRVMWLSFGLSLAVELFQITGIPLAMRDSGSMFLRVLSIALGTEFSLWDVLAYGVGVLGCTLIANIKSDSASMNEVGESNI